MPTPAIAYLRTSSQANVDGDSQHRQREAIRRFAKSAGYAIEGGSGFSQMLAQIEGNGVRLVLVEDASRLARSVLVSELAILVLKQRGVRILTASGEDLTETDDPARVLMRQVAASFAQYEK